MAKGLPRSLSRASDSDPRTVKVETFAFSDLAITIDGATGVGVGTAVIAGLPEGNILLLGAVVYASVSGPTDAGLVDTWEGDFGIGTTPADDATITAGDVDVIASTALAAATAEVSPRTRAVNAGQSIIDNTAGDLELNLNVLVDDDDISADGIACTADGEVRLCYVVLGDD